LRACCCVHRRDEDAWLFDGLKRDVDEEIRKMEGKMGVKTVEWRTLMGPSNDLSLTEIRTRDFLDKDGQCPPKDEHELVCCPEDED
jgi:hypothetical protein